MQLEVRYVKPEEVRHASRNAESACPFLYWRDGKKGHAESAFRDACRTSSDVKLYFTTFRRHVILQVLKLFTIREQNTKVWTVIYLHAKFEKAAPVTIEMFDKV